MNGVRSKPLTRRAALGLLAASPLALMAACQQPASAPAATSKPAESKPAETKPVAPAATTAPAAQAQATQAQPTAAAKPAAQATPAQSAPAQAVAKVAPAKDLVWWTTSTGLMDTLAKEYGDANGISIQAQNQGNYDQMVQKVQAGIATNSLPHIAILGQRHGIPQMADSGKLIPLADLVAQDPSYGEADFLPVFWKKFTYKGRIQTSPFINSSPVLHYNKTAFKEAGLDPEKPPTTHDELVTAAKALTKRQGDTVSQWGLGTAADTPWYAYAMIWQNGGALLADDGSPAFNKEPGIQTLQLWKAFVHEHKVMPPLQHDDSEKDFPAGKVGMLFSSSASGGGFEKQIGDKFEYGLARFPANKQRAVPVGGASLGIFHSDPAHEAAAWGFLKWLTSPEINARIAKETGYVAIRNATLDQPVMKELLTQNPRRATAIQQIRDDIRAEGISPADAVIWLGLGKVQQQLEADASADPKKLLDDLAAETAKYLKEYE
jgi:sn-glycerol 3-phosphate transport system substrate-binding protein